MTLPQLNSLALNLDADGPEPVQLPRTTRATWVASHCRETAVSFVNDSAHWGKAELATWLLGPYSQAAKYAPDVLGNRVSSVVSLNELDARFAEINAARKGILALLEMELADGTIGQFAFDMIEAGLIAPCKDITGARGWIPTKNARTLGDRIFSLFAADYMTRATMFEEEVHVCHDCQRIAFDVARRGCSGCHAARRDSGLCGTARSNQRGGSAFPPAAHRHSWGDDSWSAPTLCTAEPL